MINFEKLDDEIINCLRSNAKGYSRQCIFNALKHLDKAWRIKDIDKEMAVFRAITAQEEAALALFLVLKEKQYKNAKRIKFKEHAYKQGLVPFIRSIGKRINETALIPSFPFGGKFHLTIKGENEERKLHLYFEFKGGLIETDPPLNFKIELNGKEYHFEEEIKEVTQGESKEGVIRYIKSIANLRNELLYANTDGLPSITNGVLKELQKKRNEVMILIRIYSLIYPHKKKSLFVQQALNSYLRMMGDIKDDY